jgi:hypothetical protein
MASLVSPILHLLLFICSLFSRKKRELYWQTLARIGHRLTPEQKKLVTKAKRDALQAYQPRRVAIGRGKFRLCEHGECGGTQYSVWNTSIKELGEFGLGISGYFVHLLGLIFMCFFMTLLNIPVMFYFESSEYRREDAGSYPFFLFGTAVCTSQRDVNVITESGSYTASQNLCPYTAHIGILGMISIGGVALFVVGFKIFVSRAITATDESQQTAQVSRLQVQ